MSCLPDAEEKMQNCTENADGLREKHRHSFINLGIQMKVKNLTKKERSSVVGLESHNVTRSLKKTSSCSALEPRPQLKTWNLRERTKSVWPTQKICVNQDKRQRTKRRYLSNLEDSMQSINLWKYKEKKGDIICCKSQPQSPKNCTENLEEARSSSDSQLSNGNPMKETEHRAKMSRLRLVKSQEPEIKKENSSVALTTSELLDGIEAGKQNNQCLLECFADCEDSRKFQNTTEEGTCRIVTRAFLKSKMCRSNGEKLNWKPKKSVREISGCGQGVLKNNIEQMVDCVCAVDLLDARTRGSRKRQASGESEVVTSAECKREIVTSRLQSLEVSTKQRGKLTKPDKDYSVQNLVEQFVCFPVAKSDEIENKDCSHPCFGKEVAVYCDASSAPVTNVKCPQPFDIKVVGEKVENNTLVVCQDVKPRGPAEHHDLPCSVERFPVVRLLDCSYIKALLKPTGVKSIQSYKVHFGFLHVASSQGKVLSSIRDMRQNDLSSSPNLLQAEQSLPQGSILVEKEMCQNSNRSSRCQNKKRFRESKWCVDFKQPSKKIKISRDLEKIAIQKVLADLSVYSECGLQMEDRPAREDCPAVWGKLNYNETTCLSSLEHRADFILECLPQRPQNQLASLSCNKKVSEAHLVTRDASDFEKSLVLRKEDNVLGIKSMEPQINVDEKLNYDNSIMKMLVSENLISSNSNVGSCMRAKKTPKDKTVHKGRKSLQLCSCQRAIPVSGKNIWPRESCARTSVWVDKNHVHDLERKILRGTDLFVDSGQEESHKPLSTSKTLADKGMDHKAELPTESHDSESAFHVDKTFSAIGNGTRVSSVYRPKQCVSVTKTGKKLKVASNSRGKDVKRSIFQGSISVEVQSGALATRKSKTNKQKTSATTQELLLQTLIPRSLSAFKIPLLKNKNGSGKAEHSTSSEGSACCLLDILEDSTGSRNKTRAEQISSDLNFKYQIQSEQINVTISKEHANQFDSDFSESLHQESNEHVETSSERELRTSALDNSLDFLSTEFKKKQILESVLVPENKDEDNSNNLAQDRGSRVDILQAYEDDALVIDVIQDDPDLFGDIDEREAAYTEKFCTKTDTSIFSEQRLYLELESPQLPGYRYFKLSPRENPVEDYERLKSVADLPSAEVDEIKSESPSEISSTGDATVTSIEDGQLTILDDVRKGCIVNEKYKFPEKMLAEKEEKANIWSISKIENTQYFEPVSDDHQLEPLPAMKATAHQWQSTAVEPWMNDFRFSRKGPLLPTSYRNSHDSWKIDKNGVTNLGLLYIPRGCCRSHFNTLNGCERADCWYWHVPAPGNEKFCSEVLKKYISIGEVILLQRAVQIFTDYCKNSIPRLYLNSQMLNDLLTSLLQSFLLKELFLVIHTGVMVKILPTADILLKVFEQVASMKLEDVVPDLIDISCKLVDAGMTLEYEHVGCIKQLLNQLQISSQEITTVMSRFQAFRHSEKTSLCDFDSAVAEFQHYKEEGDWAKFGTLYLNVRRGCENVDDLEKYSLCIANILTSAIKEERPEIPFCEFVTAVNADAWHSKADKNILGRIGISVIFSYYRKQQWSKARKVLDALHALQIPFTFLKGILGHERLAPRCHIVNVAVEIFLKCGSLDGAMWVLKESEWVINTLSWPCDRMDVLTRHNLLCTMASEYITKSQYEEAFEVLRNLPGFQNSCDTVDVSQYSLLFNNLLGACLESKYLGISSAVVEFMLTKNIPVEVNLLRTLITTLGRSCLWLKARTHYKSALALGWYPPLEGNLYRKLLLIPSYMSEVEMLLAIEIFLVANASSIQSPGASSQILQIVLKRCEGKNIQKDDYRSPAERLIQAARISTPKLFIKHLTVNINKEQIYSLEYASALKWLKENMKWAGKVWLF